MNTSILLPEAAELIEALERVNSAQEVHSSELFFPAAAVARKLGFNFPRGFFIQRRTIPQETFEVLRQVRSKEELRQVLQDMAYDYLMSA